MVAARVSGDRTHCIHSQEVEGDSYELVLGSYSCHSLGDPNDGAAHVQSEIPLVCHLAIVGKSRILSVLLVSQSVKAEK